jgi:hypothetical protein
VSEGPTRVLSEDEWVEQFQPETDENGDLYVQRDWTVGEDLEVIKQALQENRLWTAVEGCGGNFYIEQGFWKVNRLFYIVCNVPFAEGEDVLVETELTNCMNCGEFFTTVNPHGVLRGKDYNCVKCEEEA